MIALLIFMIVVLIIAGLLAWAANAVLAVIGAPPPVPVLVQVLIFLIAVVVIAQRAGIL